MTKFTCVTIGFDSRPRTGDRVAATAEKAAEQCAKAMHSAYWVKDGSRRGEDSHGTFDEFTVMQSGSRAHSAVRVYAEYK
jgi:hypothetical protein